MGRSEFEKVNYCNGASDLTTTTDHAYCFIWATKVYHLLDKSTHSEDIFFSLDFSNFKLFRFKKKSSDLFERKLRTFLLHYIFLYLYF